MTFEEWWETQKKNWTGDIIYPIELAKAAWCASRGCPVRDSSEEVKSFYCPKCGG